MVQLLCSLALLLSVSARADLDAEGSVPGKTGAARIPELLRELKGLEVKDEPTFEEKFNQTVKAVENSIEEEKLICSGELADATGKTLTKDQKPLCMRELKKQYLEVMDTVFGLKKKYLGLIHKKQLENLGEIQQKLKDDIQKNF